MISGRIYNILVAETGVSISKPRLWRSCAFNMLTLTSKNAILTSSEAFQFSERLGDLDLGPGSRFCRSMKVCVPD